MNILPSRAQLLYGLTWVTGGFITASVLDKSCDSLEEPPEGISARLWDALQPKSDRTASAAHTLGLIERLLAVFVGWHGELAYAVLAGYLAFKLGSKWPVWQDVFYRPDSLDDYGIDKLEYMKATRLWGGCSLMRFLIGTMTNVLLGGAVGLLASEIYDCIRSAPHFSW